jgi:hypothetical protein
MHFHPFSALTSAPLFARLFFAKKVILDQNSEKSKAQTMVLTPQNSQNSGESVEIPQIYFL